MTFTLTEVDLQVGQQHATTAALVSHAAFHVDELLPIALALADRGIKPRLLLVEATAGPLRRLRSQDRRYRRSLELLASRGFNHVTTSVESSTIGRTDAIVVMNDWGPCHELVTATRAAGGMSFGKIEGAQDFDDVDTGQKRNAYRTVDVVLCQGDNDYAAMHGADRHLVGNTRIERIWQAPVRADNSGPAIINSNFSYGQQSNNRRAWLNGAYTACRDASLAYRVSRHPADLGLIEPWKIGRTPIEEAITIAPALISRFSSVCFEALAQGVPVAYFNPHGEQGAPFTNPQGAFEILRSPAELQAYLSTVRDREAANVRADAQAFLSSQVSVTAVPSAERSADVIASRIT